MSKPTTHQTSRGEILPRLFTLFREAGYDGVSVADIGKATGLGKSSLYHYFPGGKEDMAQAVIVYVREGLEETVFGPLSADMPREDRVEAMLRALDRIYASGKEPCILASMLVGRTGATHDPITKGLSTLLRDWVQAIANALTVTGMAGGVARHRAEAALGRIQGALLLARALDAPRIFADAVFDVRRLLLAPVTLTDYEDLDRSGPQTSK